MSLNTRRERIAGAALRWLALLGVVAYVPSLMLSVQSELWAVAIIDTLAYATVIALHLGRQRLTFRARATGLLAMFFLLGVFLVEVLGPFGAGPLWLFSFCVMSAVLFGMRGAWLASALTFATLITLGLRLGFHFLLPANTDPQYTAVWVIVAANFVFLSLVTSLSIAVILRGLEQEMAHRERAESGLRQAQKMEAMGTLASGVAHDLNNLLQPILMYAKMVQNGLPPEHEVQADVSIILSSVGSARELVKRILTFSHPAQTHRLPTHVTRILDDTLRLLRGSLPSNITVKQQLQVEHDTVLADASELQQVILNLFTNALFAMREKGGVLSIALREEARILRLVVSDNGSGMTPETVERAFEPFFTTKKIGEGTGLGLAMVQRIIRVLGGDVTLSSDLGSGTQVAVTLPLVEVTS